MNSDVAGLMSVGAAVCGISMLMLMTRRNNWVLRKRLDLNKRYHHEVKRLFQPGRSPEEQQRLADHLEARVWWDAYYMTYEQMLRRFWIFDLEKMRVPVKRDARTGEPLLPMFLLDHEDGPAQPQRTGARCD